MRKIPLIKIGLGVVWGLFIFVAIFVLSLTAKVSATLPTDDEREVAGYCTTIQKVWIACTEGTIDCNPRDCN